MLGESKCVRPITMAPSLEWQSKCLTLSTGSPAILTWSSLRPGFLTLLKRQENIFVLVLTFPIQFYTGPSKFHRRTDETDMYRCILLSWLHPPSEPHEAARDGVCADVWIYQILKHFSRKNKVFPWWSTISSLHREDAFLQEVSNWNVVFIVCLLGLRFVEYGIWFFIPFLSIPSFIPSWSTWWRRRQEQRESHALSSTHIMIPWLSAELWGAGKLKQWSQLKTTALH